MSESVRLVVWDLDETFWKGTFAEGGITYVPQNHEIVVELCRRGIMSTICSKNEFESVRDYLHRTGAWDYFIFPSISWDTKGPRLRHLIEEVQLRPASVMFIDDNHLNRAEAAAMIPGLQIEDETFIPKLLNDPRFAGKPDEAMSRLQQYKVLESKRAAQLETPGDNEAFLRASSIRVFIDYDVASHVDRAIELINRTNQLNFTRRRLPEDPDAARTELLADINRFGNVAGLIHAADKYGSYDYIGFFLFYGERQQQVPGALNRTLKHFCFSCRTLGMQIERWVFDHLGRPDLTVAGEVLTDLSEPGTVDWITEVFSAEAQAPRAEPVAPNIVMFGGCEMQVIAAYLKPCTDAMTVFGNYPVNGMFNRVNSMATALDICNRNAEDFAPEANALGLPLHTEAQDFISTAPPGTAFVFHFALDANLMARARHKTKGWTLMLEPRAAPGQWFLSLTEDELDRHLAEHHDWYGAQASSHVRAAHRHMNADYVIEHPTSADLAQETRAIIRRIPQHCKLVLILTHPTVRLQDGNLLTIDRIEAYKQQTKAIADEFPYVGAVDLIDAVTDPAELLEADHFARQVYMRVAGLVRATLEQIPSRPDVPIPEQITRRDEMDYEHVRRTREAREFVSAVYQSFFGRDPEGDVHVEALASGRYSYAAFVRGLVEADEFKLNWSRTRL